MTETSNTPRQIKKFSRPVTRRAVLEAAKNMAPVKDGQRYLIRFAVGNRILHLVVMTSVFVLAITGLTQSFDTTRPAQAILVLLGGLEGTQQIHHFFALILMAAAIYHLALVVDGVFVRLQPAVMLPGPQDFANLFQMVAFNLGLTKKLPQNDRYSFDEKFVYWVTVIAVVILSLTGLIMWFPSIATQILPGSAYLYATTLHRWQAIFVLTIMIFLHLYQVLVRRQNFSIFNGQISLADMKTEHPVELAYLKKAAPLAEMENLPKNVKFSVEEITVILPQKVKTPKANPQPITDEDPAETDELEAVENLATNIPSSGETSL